MSLSHRRFFRTKTQQEPTIAELKEEARRLTQRYYSLVNGFEGDCGAHMAAVINPGIGIAARNANEALRKLQRVDPNFPSNWTPFPEGN